ncbi:MAG: carbohydrate ABC transporter permease [Lachnospiraceae bacterium]|uniref:Carbohydrate ABC transporter permease n=1 Tax=Candidatus Enterocloster faecavium TaxID=2838560 RepID=A0A9D2L5Y1_9FIRM|nr:carbohydrate ABC transporter permease [Merdimonas faecis]MBS5546032.1 carbohydrate ABC transporter permease [Lachnospiraceae bacterium]HJB06491.1 carbohydrate ABC transporter permease [Candidatus Enterocloster faecavium]
MARSKSRRNRIGIGEIVWLAVLIILAILIIYPMFWIVMSSFKDYNGIFKDVWGLPKEWLFENYKTAWDRGISNYFINSLIVSAGTIAGVVVLTTFAAFGICQLKNKLASVCFLAIMGGLLLSPQVCLLPLYMLLKNMGIKDTYAALIIPYIAFRIPVSVMLIRSFFIGIPKDLEESALIDGASLFQIYRKIYLPLSKPIVSTVVIMTAYYAWNEFVFATMFIDSSQRQTIPVGLMVFSDGLMTNWGVVMAGMVIACLPIIVLFIVMQKSFIRGITAGSVKG